MILYNIKSNSIMDAVPAVPIIYNLLPNRKIDLKTFNYWLDYLRPLVMRADRPKESFNSAWMETADGDTQTYNDMFQTVAPLFMYRKPTMCAIYTGNGYNGKSSWLAALTEILGDDLYSGMTISDMSDYRNLPQLRGKLANISSDEGTSKIKETGTFKKLTDHEVLKGVRLLGGNETSDIDTSAIFTLHCMNKLALSDDNTDGFLRRIKIVKFEHKFEKGKYIAGEWEAKTFTDEFMTRHLAEIIAYAEYFTKHGWKDSPYMQRNVEQYASISNRLSEYVNLFNRYVGGYSRFKDLYNDYRIWCEDEGEEVKPQIELKHMMSDYYSRYSTDFNCTMFLSNKYEPNCPLTQKLAQELHHPVGPMMFGDDARNQVSLVTKLYEEDLKAKQEAREQEPEEPTQMDIDETVHCDFEEILKAPVFPVSKKSKVPLVKWSNPENLHPIEWWMKNAKAKYPQVEDPETKVDYGLPTGDRTQIHPGRSLIVVDVDQHDPESDSQDWYDELVSSGEVPETLRINTPHGRHYYFWYDENMKLRNTASILHEGVDTRADGGYVKSPVLGTFYKGQSYKPQDISAPIAKLPRVFLDALLAHQRKASDDVWKPFYPQTDFSIDKFVVDIAAPGYRNQTLIKVLGKACAMGASYAQLEAITHEFCTRTGLPEKEAKATLRSAARWIK